MKKLLIMVLAVMLVFTACGKKNEKKTENEVKNTPVTEQKQDEKTPDTKKEPENKETEQKNNDAQNQDKAVAVDGEELESFLNDYEKAKEAGNEEAERAALDEIQKILEQGEAQSVE